MAKCPKIALVTGHEFGIAALLGLICSKEYEEKKFSVDLIVAPSADKTKDIVGYSNPLTIASQIGASTLIATDSKLEKHRTLIADHQIDCLLVIGWSYLIAKNVRQCVRRTIDGIPATIGMHPSPLPVGRGRAPIPWTILKQLKKTALTVFLLDDKADSGPIVVRYPFTVPPNSTSSDLFRIFQALHYSAGEGLAQCIANWKFATHKQDEALATRWLKRLPEDSCILPGMTIAEAMLLVRAARSPYPQAYIETPIGKRVIHVLERAPTARTKGRIQLNDGELWYY